MDFERRKAKTLASLAAPWSDKSPKGSIDAPIASLLSVINLHPSFFTTSSCSGRISVLRQPCERPNYDSKEENKILTKKSKKKAGGGGWVYVTHDPADPEALVNLLFEHSRHSGENETVGEEGGILVFRFEPLIVAVDCKDVASAQELVSTAISCGFRESGITSIQKRVMVAIRCSIRLEVPLGQIGLIMVTPEYVRYLVTVANEKMEANRQRTDGFLHVLQEKVIPAFSRKVTCSQIVRPSIIVGKNSLNIEAKRGDMCSEKPLPEKKFQSHNSYNNAFSSEHKD